MSFVGIDLGSRFVKVAVESFGAITYNLYDTVEFYKNFVKRVDNKIIIDKSFLQGDIDGICATGYGRNILSFHNVEVISEIKAHYRGALEQLKEEDFVLIDIGGQDSKIIMVHRGYIEDFIMNDKCAASSGRFLEVAANILHMKLEELGSYYKNPAKLSSTCSVFAESEIIGKIAEGYPFEEIAAGVNESIAKRIVSYAKRYTKHKIIAAGGVSKLPAVVYFMEQFLNRKVDLLPEPHFNGALGCLYYAKEKR
ncbi:MAG: acyl-CoA dehydratase activase [Deferribacterales bacterium]